MKKTKNLSLPGKTCRLSRLPIEHVIANRARRAVRWRVVAQILPNPAPGRGKWEGHQTPTLGKTKTKKNKQQPGTPWFLHFPSFFGYHNSKQQPKIVLALIFEEIVKARLSAQAYFFGHENLYHARGYFQLFM